MPNVSSDISKQVNWTVRKKTDVTLTLTFTASGIYDTSGLTLSCSVYSGASLVLGPSIVNGGVTGIVTITITDTQSNISANDYFWKLSTSTPSDVLLLQGLFIVNDFTWDSEDSNSSNSVIVDIEGTDVTISIATA